MKTLTQILGDKLWIHHEGETFCVELESQAAGRSKKKKHQGTHTGEVLAPMPGKITRLFKSTGDQVKKGNAVLVMEAMKMEYTLKAEINGQVQSVSCSIGEQVILGKLLMQIKPEAVDA